MQTPRRGRTNVVDRVPADALTTVFVDFWPLECISGLALVLWLAWNAANDARPTTPKTPKRPKPKNNQED